MVGASSIVQTCTGSPAERARAMVRAVTTGSGPWFSGTCRQSGPFGARPPTQVVTSRGEADVHT